MNDEIIEQINLIRYKLEDTIKEYQSILDDVSLEEQERLKDHITQLKKQSEELYQWFI